MDLLWCVVIRYTHWGDGEEWTYILAAKSAAEAIEIARTLNKDFQVQDRPQGLWEFYAEELQLGEVAYATWGDK